MSTHSTKKNAVGGKLNARSKGHRTANVRQAAKYAAPTAAVLGTGALATAGVIMRKQLVELASAALAEGMSATKDLNLGKLLGYLGLKRRRSLLSTSLQGAGILAVGLASGAALIYWLLPARSDSAGDRSHGLDAPTNHNSVSTSADAVHAPV
jgi:hypothetical protein